MASPIDDAKAAGYTDEEINNYLAPRVAAARAAGYSDDEINKHLGITPAPPFDPAAMQKQINANLSASPKPVTSFEEALTAGWQISTAGLVTRGAPPTKTLAADAPWYSRIGAQVAEMAGDIPAMVGGFMTGAAGASFTGPGAAVAGAAGAFALPTALRETLMDAYGKGQFRTFPDFWGRASGVFIDTAKSWITGAATSAAGTLVKAAQPAIGAAIPTLASPTMQAATKTAAEIATMTTVGRALEGQVPSAQDFVDAAILLGGLKFAEVGAGKLRNIYARMGISPSAVTADAARDVTIQQDLLGDKEIPDAYAAALERPEGMGAEEAVGRAEAAGRTAEPGATASPEVPETSPPRATAFAPENEPQRLASFLMQQGGLQDQGGDVRHTLGGARFRPGLISSGGLADDEAALRAWETGYFPEHGENRPSINDLRNALDEDLRGFPRYSFRDEAAVTAYQEARSTNAEVLRLSSDLGIPTEGLTRDQFFDRVAERMSAEEMARRQGEIDTSLAASSAELDRRAQEHGVDLAGDVASRSLEDLENEYRQAQAAGALGAGAGGGGQSGPPGGTPPTGEGGAGPGGGAAGPSGRGTAQERILAHISVGESAPGRGWSLDRLYTYAFDRLFPLNRATTEAAKAIGEAPSTSDNPYRLGRLYAGVVGKADQMLNRGTFDFNTYATNGPSLRQVLEPVSGDLDGFRAFLASRRALELEGRGIQTGFDLDAARQVVAHGARYEGAAEALLGYQNRVVTYLLDAGVLSQAGYDAMLEANKLYVPFQRLMDEGDPLTLRVPGGSLTPSNPIRRIEGSERVVIDPLESVIRNTYHLTQMAERNAVGTALVDLLERANEARGRAEPPAAESGDPLADLARGTADTKPDEIRIFRDGRPETYEVDPEVAAAFKGLDREAANTLLRMMAMPARMLRAGATLTPDFMARNLIRDFFTAVVNTGRGVFSPIDTLRGLASALSHDEYYQDWLKGGGANAAMVSLDRTYLQSNLEVLTRETGLMTRAWNVVRHPIESLRAVSELSEQATRLGEFRKIYDAAIDAGRDPKEAAQEAAYSSREVTLDFARMGAKTQSYNMITAFANAQLQGADRLVRSFKDRPVSTSLKVLGGITLPSVLLWWNNQDEPWVQDLPRWQRDLFWTIPIHNWRDAKPRETVGLPPYMVRQEDGRYKIDDGFVLRIPKPFETGVLFGSGPERLLDALFASRQEAFRGFTDSVLSALSPSFIPTLAQPIVEQFANRSTFTDRPLVPQQQEKFLPEYQYAPYTTETAKAIGQALGAFPGIGGANLQQGMGGAVARALTSPILMENYLRAWTGNLGLYALQASDAGLRKAGVLPDPPQPASTLADIPFVKAFIVRYPTASAESIQNFQDDYARNKAYFDTWMAQAKDGNMESMRRVQQVGGQAMLIQLTGIHDALNQQSQLVRNIYKNPEIAPAEKRQLIDTTYWRMSELAHIGNDVLRAAKAAR